MSISTLIDTSVGSIEAEKIACKLFTTDSIYTDLLETPVLLTDSIRPTTYPILTTPIEVLTDELKLGTAVCTDSRLLHVQSTKDADLWLEGDTDNVTETDVPHVHLTSDANLVMCSMAINTQGFDFDTRSVEGTTHQSIDFCTNGTYTNNGLGTLPTDLTHGPMKMRVSGGVGEDYTTVRELAIGDPEVVPLGGHTADALDSHFTSGTANNHTLITTQGIDDFCGSPQTLNTTFLFPAGALWNAEYAVPIRYLVHHQKATILIGEGMHVASGNTTAPSAPLPAALQPAAASDHPVVLCVDGNPPTSGIGNIHISTTHITFYSIVNLVTWVGNATAGTVGFRACSVTYRLT